MPRTGTTWAKRALVAPVAALLLAGLGACGGNDDTADQAGDPANGSGASPAIAIGEPAPGIPSGEFLSTAVSDGGEPKKLVEGTHISLAFEAGSVRASAGCNTMSGTVTFDQGHLVIGDLAQTDMGCPGDGRYEQDTWVATFLGKDPAYTFDGTTLDLTIDTAQIVLKPRSQVVPDLPLEGTRWDVTHVTSGPAAGAPDDPNAAVSAGIAPANAFLQFDGGKLSGNDGCNTLTGTATVKGDTITFGEIASTKKACQGVDTSGVRKVLAGTVTWKITTAVLTLAHPSGAGLQLQAHQNASDMPLNSGTGGSGDAVTPPCCKPLVGESGAPAPSGGATGSSGSGGAPTTVNTAGPAEPPQGY